MERIFGPYLLKFLTATVLADEVVERRAKLTPVEG